MRPVVIESPFGMNPDGSRADAATVARNIQYLNAAMLHSFGRGEAPYASHGLYPAVLADAKPDERELGITAGFVWGRFAKLRAVYVDLGITPGMKRGLEEARAAGQVVEFRVVPGWRREESSNIEDDLITFGGGR